MRLIGSLQARSRGKESIIQNLQESKLTFEITSDYPEQVLWTDQSKFRAIGRKGSENIYSVIALGVTSHDMRLLGSLKHRVGSALGGSSAANLVERIANADALASNLLSEHRTDGQRDLLSYMLAHEVCGHGAISMLLDDSSNIEEIVVNSPTSRIGLYHVNYGYCTTNLRFSSQRAFRYSINRLISSTERELNASSPIIDAQLDDGSRLHAQIKPYALSGAAATIRLVPSKRMDIRRMMQTGFATPEILAYLWFAIDARLNIVIAGAPASGKTSLLLSLSAFMPRNERVITVEEDVNELRGLGNIYNMVPLQGSSILGRASTRDQVINALHLRPERLIVGEIRGSEAAELMSGANLGIPFMTTMHSSDGGQSVLNRLGARPMSVQHDVLSNLDVSIFLSHAGSARVIGTISEYLWLQRAEIGPEAVSSRDYMVKTNTIAANHHLSLPVEGSKAIRSYARLFMMPEAKALKELRARTAFLKAMLNEENASADVSEYIARYGSLDEKRKYA